MSVRQKSKSGLRERVRRHVKGVGSRTAAPLKEPAEVGQASFPRCLPLEVFQVSSSGDRPRIHYVISIENALGTRQEWEMLPEI